MRFWLQLVIAWLSFVGLWFLFVYQLSLTELIAGAGAAAVTIVGLELSLKVVPLRFQPELRWLLLMLRLPGTVIRDMGVLVRIFFRLITGKKIPGLFQVTDFSALGEGPRANARRALAVVFTTVSPNSVVVGIDRKTGLLLFHELEATPVPQILKELRN